MKNLIIINGTMGVGKTTVSRILQEKLPNCVFLDGDWCWDMKPFLINDETKKMVVTNIRFLLNKYRVLLGHAGTENFRRCSIRA